MKPPSAEPTNCPEPCPCGNVATKWSGHDLWSTIPMENIGVRFRCEECDPHNKWFIYIGEALYKDKQGLWRIGNG